MLSGAKHPATSTDDSNNPETCRTFNSKKLRSFEVAGFFALLRMTNYESACDGLRSDQL